MLMLLPDNRLCCKGVRAVCIVLAQHVDQMMLSRQETKLVATIANITVRSHLKRAVPL